MAEPVDYIDGPEKQIRNEMLFTLSERDKGTLAIVVTSSEWKRNELYHFLKSHLKEYTFFDLDLAGYSYTSLYKGMQELLPDNLLHSEPVQYLVSITNLENSFYQAGSEGISSLVEQLNFERELIFNQPYIVLLWVSEGFDRELQKKAPDLMQWMSKRFVIEDNIGGAGFRTSSAIWNSRRARRYIQEI